MKQRVLITRKVFPEVVEALSRHFDVVTNADDRPWSPDEIAARLKGCSAALSTVMCRFDATVLAASPGLKVISNIAVGYNNIDVAEATKRRIFVTNTPGVLDETTADLTWALMMAAARRVPEADAFVRRGDWQVAFSMSAFLGADLHGATLGVIGMGRIGQAIARRALGFNMRVLYHNRTRLREADELRLKTRHVERDELLALSDFVVVMVPYSQATHHLISATELAKMKPTAVFVNTARGGVVDDAALVDALREGRIAAAGIDVFEGEPRLHAGFLDLPNAVLTPHIGSASRATRLAMCAMAQDNLMAALAGRVPPNLVNKELA